MARSIRSQNFFTHADAISPAWRRARQEPAAAAPAPVEAPAPVAVPAPIYAPAPAYAAAPSYNPAAYNFAWEVLDTYSANDFGHTETRNDKLTTGSYHVALPDGRVQTVTYTVDGYGGYSAQVSYDGQAAFPEYKPAPYKPAPAYVPAPAPYHPAPAAPAYVPAPAPAAPAPAEPEQEAQPVAAPAVTYPVAAPAPAPYHPVVTAAPSTIRRYSYNVVKPVAPAAPREEKSFLPNTATINEIEEIVEVEKEIEKEIEEIEAAEFFTTEAPIEEEAEQITTEQPQPASYYYRFY